MPNYLPLGSGRSQKLSSAWLQTSRTEEIVQFARTAVLPSSAAATPVSLIAESEVPAGFSVFVEDWSMKVSGATPWATAANVKIQDTNSSPVDFTTVAVAGLTANAYLKPNSSNVTVDPAMSLNSGGTLGRGLQVKGNANGTGSDLYVTVVGFLKKA